MAAAVARVYNPRVDQRDINAPQLRRLHEDWDQRRRGREFPARADFDPLDLKYILGDLSLVDVLRDPLRFRYRLHASNLVNRGGIDMTGRLVDEMPDERRRGNTLRHYNKVMSGRAPSVVSLQNEYTDLRSWHCEVLVLPLATDGATIDMLMVAFAWENAD
ncbi:MAG: PAS domain-containing protein [Alphaproteobacteria bacterium]|nr:PAS domain-containing protein [Alphaproteobacteria bacterium]